MAGFFLVSIAVFQQRTGDPCSAVLLQGHDGLLLRGHGSNIYLEDAFGLRWRVRVCLSDGVMSFGHGWKNFVLDHAVSCGEFLVFRQIARDTEGRSRRITRNSEVPIRHHCQAQEVLDAEVELGDDCTVSQEKRSQCNARVSEHPTYDATEMEHDEGLNSLTNVDTSEPLALMDLNEVSIDFLSADINEFETDGWNPEAFPVDLNMEEPITTGQGSGFNCLEHAPQNRLCSMGDDQRFFMPETLSCMENKETSDVLEIGTGYACIAAHDIDINALPANEPSVCGEENSSSPADPEVHSVKQDGEGNKRDSTWQNTAEVISSSAKLHEHPDLGQNLYRSENNQNAIQNGNSESDGVLALCKQASSKFAITVPAPCQTWAWTSQSTAGYTKNEETGKEVVILKDPLNRSNQERGEQQQEYGGPLCYDIRRARNKTTAVSGKEIMAIDEGPMAGILIDSDAANSTGVNVRSSVTGLNS
ncbi:hypothetical protein HU200_011355 [Digitaria exilis]|uniref:TF-B3 domain-containing protein n=1 Tax=Digitaria exilis TaxID=1010633 RepID=A0A835FGI9_9POAL|nr:hypothetical protein HU200_011355 [Digitaria exilis]